MIDSIPHVPLRRGWRTSPRGSVSAAPGLTAARADYCEPLDGCLASVVRRDEFDDRNPADDGRGALLYRGPGLVSPSSPGSSRTSGTFPASPAGPPDASGRYR